MPSGKRQFTPGRPLLFYIVALVLAVIVPALVFSAAVMWQWVAVERARLEAEMAEVEDDISARLDRYLIGHVGMLEALATSPALDGEDHGRFDREARTLVGLSGVNIVLRDRMSQQRVNTRLPLGSALPRSSNEADQVVARSKQPHVSDLFIGAVTRDFLIIVNVPVIRNGEVTHFLNASIPPSAIEDIVRQAGVAAPYFAAVVDRKGLTITRSQRAEASVGQPHPIHGSATDDRGKLSSVTLEGVPVVSTYRRSPLSGWIVTVGVQQAALDAPLRQSAGLLAGLAVLLGLMALGAAVFTGRRILFAQQELAAAAVSLGRGGAIEAPRTPLREVNQVGEALAAASRRISEQAAALLDANQTLEARVDDRTREVTEQAARLRESEARYRLLADHSTDMIVRNRLDGTREYVSPASLRLLGYSPEELMGRPMTAIIHPEDQPRVAATHRSIIVERKDHGTATYRMSHKDGHWIWVEVNIKPVIDETGAPTAIVGMVRDVSDRRRAADRLRESEARYRLLADNASDMIVQADLDTTRRYVSPASRELLGYEPEELLATRPMDFVHPEEAEGYRRVLDSLSRGETDLAVSRQRYRRKDGSYVWTEATFRLIRNEAGEATGYVAAVRDVSERQRQDEELRLATEVAERALSKAQHASRSKSDFLAAMSHEIRTPLNSIIGFTNLLLEGKQAPEERRRLDLIQASGAALLSVVNDILDFSKIEAGQIELDPGPLSVPALIDNTVSIIRGVAAHKRIEIVARLDPTVPAHLIGDAGRLRQVLLNLMNNAVKFTNGGQVAVAVRNEGLSADVVRLRFEVTDTGIGIPEDKMGRLFERFSQVDSSITRRYGGTGLGLAISKRLVTLMGGTIGVDSVEGEGSTFWFTVSLPVSDEADAAATPSWRLTPQAIRPARILLAEDLDINQELACAVLEGAGHKVAVVADGAAALEAVRRERYDVVLMDVQMPVMDGLTATQRIRALGGAFETLPIVAMTANVLPEQIARFKQAGMNDHVGKPFRKDELLQVIDRWLPDDHAAPEPTNAAPASEVLDRGPYDQIVTLLGRAKTAGLLKKLERRLTEQFGVEPQEAIDVGQLGAQAHAIVSAAGMLGFRALSEAAREVEAACSEGRSLEAALNKASAAREQVLAEIAPLKAQLEPAAAE